MSDRDDDPFDRYSVVVNDEEQFSIWPVVKPMPDGWSSAGFEGGRSECLAHIEKVWTDIRPRSVRMGIEQSASEP